MPEAPGLEPATVAPVRDLDVVFAHDFAEAYGGAERIIAEAAAVFPDAPFYAITGRHSVARRMGVADRFHAVLPARAALLRHYRLLAPLYPAIVRSVRLPQADVLVTSSYAYAHGFATRNDAPQVCYCYGPLRLAWSMTDAYAADMFAGPLGRGAFRAFATAMRAADRRASRRVTRYLTEGPYAAELIQSSYGRTADVVGAPVDCERFRPSSEPGHDDFFLFCGRLVEAYKRPSVVVRAFHSLPDERLVVAGDGPALADLRAMAPANVEFTGHLEDDELIPLMQRCTAAIFPSQDDFGLIPVEVAACGRPVLALAAGGALHTVRAGVSGEFFAKPTAEAIVEAVRGFDPAAYAPDATRRHAMQWDRRLFQRAIVDAVRDAAAGR